MKITITAAAMRHWDQPDLLPEHRLAGGVLLHDPVEHPGADEHPEPLRDQDQEALGLTLTSALAALST